ncbi:MAG: hypothetical protein ACREBG_21375 [Pyrinomonadaceae bacterium]
MHFKTLSTGLFLATLLAICVNAQQAEQKQEASGLALEIVYYKGAPPSYLAVPVASSKPKGAWYARFGRIASWQLPAGQLPIRAVNITSRTDGDEVAIRVSVLRGLKFHDQETSVATYNLREKESVFVKELEQFGVEPFRVGVIKVAPGIPSMPVVISLVQSLSIISAEPLNSTLPTYKLTLQNLSSKNISALRIEVLNAGKLALSSTPHGKDGSPLINARALHESVQPLVTHAQPGPGGFAPVAPSVQETVISSLVFEDGSYEGDPAAAAVFRSFVLGRKLALTRLLAIFATMVETSSMNQESAAEIGMLRDRVQALSNAIDEDALANLQGEFPALDQEKKAGLRSAAEVALHSVQKEMLDSLEAFEKAQPTGQGDFRAWLAKTEERYRSWLARL